MSRASEAVKRWRKNTKDRIVQAMGGKCVVCGYHKSTDALELHHIERSEKDFGLGAIRGSPRSWAKIVVELRKCVLLCSNCHREVECGMTHLPPVFAKFDESFAEYRTIPK